MDGYFTNDTFRFLRELAANNERPWFQENKPRYEEHVKDASIASSERSSAATCIGGYGPWTATRGRPSYWKIVRS